MSTLTILCWMQKFDNVLVLHTIWCYKMEKEIKGTQMLKELEVPYALIGEQYWVFSNPVHYLLHNWLKDQMNINLRQQSQTVRSKRDLGSGSHINIVDAHYSPKIRSKFKPRGVSNLKIWYSERPILARGPDIKWATETTDGSKWVWGIGSTTSTMAS